MKFSLISIFLCFSLFVNGQSVDHSAPLNFDFSEGNWEIFILRNEGPKELMQDVKNIYTNDLDTIKNILNTLILSKDTISKGFAFYTHSLYVLHNGILKQEVWLKSNSEKINIVDHHYNYSHQNFLNNIKNLKEVQYCSVQIPKRKKAKELAVQLEKTPGAFNVYYYDTLWQDYKGKLKFEVEFEQNVNHDIDDISFYVTQRESRIKQIQLKIQENLGLFPQEYQLRVYSMATRDDKDVERYIFCSNKKPRKFGKYFNVLEKWEKFKDINFFIYGLKKEEVLKLID